ncbi:MAG: ribonuclease H-like domain-containing protein [Spirochaetaceae bacterium]|nr:ribonuclease H-like domain-containing protein [Spirochaetaceae bacterium]
MSSLSQRLDRLRKAGGRLSRTNPSRPAPSTAGSFIEPPGRDWENIADGAWERSIVYPGLLPDVFKNPFVLTGEIPGEKMMFYDLETTGLSGGAGNIAFLIGLGMQESGNFTVTQLFLEDYPGEPALLERYSELIGNDLPQVSYNGRSFDSQVLKTRFLLNRMPPHIPPQIDLLYPSRRLWKGVLPDLSLGTLEKEVLGFYRKDDLPGREAPDAWFEWLKGDSERIAGVFQHNSDDIVSLARLLVHLEAWGDVKPGRGGSQGRTPEGVPPSHRGMARQ